MSDTRVKCHPTLGILIGTDGHVMIPQSGTNKAHWTFGCKNAQGYMVVRIAGKTYKVHRLVAEAFIPNPENKPQVDHISRQKDQNSVDNLRWATPSDNQRNTPQHDRVDARGGTHRYEDAQQYQRENQARYRAEHPEKKREESARYYAKNKDKVLEKQARYYAKNKDKVRGRHARYNAENREKVREQKARYRQSKRKTHRRVLLSNGSYPWIPNEQAHELLKLPVKERIWTDDRG